MACEVCEHCNSSINDRATIYQGCSYHYECSKCFVCSETDLHGAEVFRGAIFCSSCSKRIFQGCSSAKRSKNRSRRKSRPTKTGRHENVIEIARRHINDSRSDSNHEENRRSMKNVLQENLKKNNKMKKDSVEMGTTTDVTQELLKQMHYPILDKEEQAAPPEKPDKSKKEMKKKSCSDLRIAELGASTEIAHMALRQRSAIPIIIKSETVVKRNTIQSLSLLNYSDAQLSESNCSSRYYHNLHLLDRRLGSILKIPYVYFRKNILDRSPLVSDRNNSSLLTKLKSIFNADVIKHQKRGLKKLFSTINRKNTPYKLGWLPVQNRSPRRSRYGCKHFKRSHSYRCMRAQVMRLAGPTASELHYYRSKMKRVLPTNVLKRVTATTKQC